MKKSQYEKSLIKLKRKWTQCGTWLGGECTQCGERKLFFYDKYDAVCCIGCDIWFNAKCSEPKCPLCSSRPETPSEALFAENPVNAMKKDWTRDNYQHKMNGKSRHEHKKEYHLQTLENREWR